MLHRSAWSLVLMLGLLLAMRRFAWLRQVALQPRTLALFAYSAASWRALKRQPSLAPP